MQLKQYYKISVDQLGYVHDPDQLIAVNAFADLQEYMMQSKTPTFSFSALRFLNKTSNRKGKNAGQGLYVWGGVGRGKTWIMDLFYNSTTLEKKTRLHFHHFMQQVHVELNALKGQRDPLQKIARLWKERFHLICLDEFHVNDITDAMLLYGLLDALFANGIALVTTSNIPPDELYKNGLQRERFLPAIDLLKRFTRIINLGGDSDYRLRGESKSKAYYTPLSDEVSQLLAAHYDALCTRAGLQQEEDGIPVIMINNRNIDVIAKTAGIIWFSFHSLCCTARSAIDFIAIAQQYHTVIISDVLCMSDAHDDWARRFINLIDVFYDHKLRLIMSAETELEQLYQGRRLQFEFGRTQSRIKEMQTREYMDRSRAAQEHAA